MSDTERPLITFGVPSECPACGGPIDFAERSKDGRTVVLCRGECGEWSVIDR